MAEEAEQVEWRSDSGGGGTEEGRSDKAITLPSTASGTLRSPRELLSLVSFSGKKRERGGARGQVPPLPHVGYFATDTFKCTCIRGNLHSVSR